VLAGTCASRTVRYVECEDRDAADGDPGEVATGTERWGVFLSTPSGIPSDIIKIIGVIMSDGSRSAGRRTARFFGDDGLPVGGDGRRASEHIAVLSELSDPPEGGAWRASCVTATTCRLGSRNL
jgi:hypothetical protein